jgi:hypothetical protein
VQVIVDAKKKERHPAQEIKVGVGWHGGMILTDPHNDAPKHACKKQQHGGTEA